MLPCRERIYYREPSLDVSLSQANKITMIASGDGAIGANRITGEVLEIMGSLPDTVKRMTGVDISAKMITVQD